MGRRLGGFALTAVGFAALAVGVTRLASHDLAMGVAWVLGGLGALRASAALLRPFVAE